MTENIKLKQVVRTYHYDIEGKTITVSRETLDVYSGMVEVTHPSLTYVSIVGRLSPVSENLAFDPETRFLYSFIDGVPKEEYVPQIVKDLYQKTMEMERSGE